MDNETEIQSSTPVELTAEIVAAYVSGNHVQATELPALIANVHAALTSLGNEVAAEPISLEKPTAAQIKKSITPDHLISFLDGKPYKTLKRHLSGNGLSIEEYRLRYGLPLDYPSTSASYSAQRSELAKSLGLGQQRRKASPMAAAVVETVTEAPRARGRPRKGVEASETTPRTRGRKNADAPA